MSSFAIAIKMLRIITITISISISMTNKFEFELAFLTECFATEAVHWWLLLRTCACIDLAMLLYFYDEAMHLCVCIYIWPAGVMKPVKCVFQGCSAAAAAIEESVFGKKR